MTVLSAAPDRPHSYEWKAFDIFIMVNIMIMVMTVMMVMEKIDREHHLEKISGTSNF